MSEDFVTVALTLPIDAENRASILVLYRDLDVLRESMTVPGAIDTWFAEPAGADDTLVVFTRWTSAAGYAAWCADPRRDAIVEQLRPLLAGEPSAVMFTSWDPPEIALG